MDQSEPIQEDRAGGTRNRQLRRVAPVADSHASAAQQAVAETSEPATAKRQRDGSRENKDMRSRRAGSLRSQRTDTPAVPTRGRQQLVIDDGDTRSKRSGTSQRIDAAEPQTFDSGARVVKDQSPMSRNIGPPQDSLEMRAVADTSYQATTAAPSSGVGPGAGAPRPIKRRPVPKRAPQILPGPQPGDLRPYAPWEYQDPPTQTQETPKIAKSSVSKWTKRSDSLTRMMKNLVRSTKGSKRSKAYNQFDKHRSEADLPRTEPPKSREKQRAKSSRKHASSSRRNKRKEPSTPSDPTANLKPTGILPTPLILGAASRSFTDQYLVPSLGPDRYGRTALDLAHELPLGSQRYLKAASSLGKGDILAAPVHTPNLHRATRHRYSMTPLNTPHGPVYSMRRLVVVLWLFTDTMLCLPLYSFAQEGIMAVPQSLRKEYVALKDEKDQTQHAGGGQDIQRIQVGCYGMKQMHPSALVHLAGAVEVGFKDDVVCVGRLSEKSFEELTTAHAVAGEQTVNCPWQRRMEAKHD